jgi:hypothetical protein
MTIHPNGDDYFNRAQRAEAECAELRAENERLREGLAGIANDMPAYIHAATNHVDAISIGVNRKIRALLRDRT